MKKLSLCVLCLLAYVNVALAKFAYRSFDLDFGRALLNKRWRKCTTETRTKYTGKSLETFRGVKNSHSCCVKCKRDSRCDRWTYLPGEWSKCTLFNKKERSIRKVNALYHISGYASWRLNTKDWPKVKKVSESDNNKNKNDSNNSEEEVYNPPGFDVEEAYNPSNWLPSGNEEVYNPPGYGSGEEEVYNPPGFDGSFYDEPSWSTPGCDPFFDGVECLIDEKPIKDYTRMNGKTLYGRRLNSIMNCVGNKASTSSRCEYLCNNESKCTGWTWTELDCSWVGERDLTGVCYLMSETDENDIFDAPEGTFISGLLR